MSSNSTLIKTINIPPEQIKRTTLAKSLFYDKLEIYENRVVGYLNGQQEMTWYFKEYSGIDIVKANLNSQFAQIVFMTGMNSKNRAIGIDFGATQNAVAMNDTNRILFCSGMFSFAKTNEYAMYVGRDIRAALENYKNSEIETTAVIAPNSAADEIKKFKELLDSGIITQEEFEAKKKQLLALPDMIPQSYDLDFEAKPEYKSSVNYNENVPKASLPKPDLQTNNFCRNCGAKLNQDGGSFCSNCGIRL